MARIVFTPNVQRLVECPETEAAGGSVREVLDTAFASNPQARSYVLDDQAALRRHMTIFVDGRGVHTSRTNQPGGSRHVAGGTAAR